MYELEKIERRMRELEKFRFVDTIDITNYTKMETSDDVNPIVAVPENINGGTLNINDFFIGAGKYLWIDKNIKMPTPKEGYQVFGQFDFGTTGGGHNSGFESLLYINNKPYCGVDTNHMEVNFNEVEGLDVKLTFLLWAGLWGGGEFVEQIHMIKTSKIGYLHIATDEYYYLTKAIYKTLLLLNDTDTNKHFLLKAVNNSFNMIDYDTDKFYDTVVLANNYLENEIKNRVSPSDITVHTVGHTHIDVAWLWRLKHTREKSGRSFATANKLMKDFPEFKFLQTQPQLYKFVKNDYPSIYEEIKNNVKNGQWEADGGMWLEADCNLSSGESLVRQFLFGINFLKDEFGDLSPCKYLWLPDVFGYSWALPQILKLCDIKTFMTTKISWNQYNSIPNDSFIWRGIDGSEVLTHFITTPEVNNSFDKPYSTYNGLVSPRTLIGTWHKYKNKNVSNDILISYGFGDGGGGVNRNMLMMQRAMSKLSNSGLPNVKPNKATDFFDTLHDNVKKNRDYVATWDGELYLEYHRGTYTTQAYNKKMNRLMENKLAISEWLGVINLLNGYKYDKKIVDESWEIVLRNQFHDIIPGSSIREVYEDTYVEYEQINKNIDELNTSYIKNLVDDESNTYTLTNFSSYDQTEIVNLKVSEQGSFYDNETKAKLVSVKHDNCYDVLVTINALSIKTITFVPEQIAPIQNSQLDFNNCVDNDYYVIKWNDDGQIISMFDKQYNRELVESDKSFNSFVIYEDKPINYDAWDIDPFYVEKFEIVKQVKKPVMKVNTELKKVIEFTYKYKSSIITQDVIIYNNSRRIDFKTHVNWAETQKLLKVEFNVNIRSTKATYDIQYGHVERPNHYNTSWDRAKFEVVAHKWADISEDSYGISLLNNCKYGHSVLDKKMTISLLKSSKSPDTQADMGEHDFTYYLFPHANSVTKGGTIREGLNVNLPINVYNGTLKDVKSTLFRQNQLIDNNVKVHFDAIKLSETKDSIILRVHEVSGSRGAVEIESDYLIKSYNEVNLLEKDLGSLVNSSVIKFDIKPFEIKTYKINF